MGLNDRGQKYDGIELIFRDAAKVEQFIGYTNCTPALIRKSSTPTYKPESWQQGLERE